MMMMMMMNCFCSLSSLDILRLQSVYLVANNMHSQLRPIGIVFCNVSDVSQLFRGLMVF